MMMGMNGGIGSTVTPLPIPERTLPVTTKIFCLDSMVGLGPVVEVEAISSVRYMMFVLAEESEEEEEDGVDDGNDGEPLQR